MLETKTATQRPRVAVLVFLTLRSPKSKVQSAKSVYRMRRDESTFNIQSLFSEGDFGPWTLDFLEPPTHARGKLKIVPRFLARGERNQDRQVCRWIERREIGLVTTIVNQCVAAFEAGHDML